MSDRRYAILIASSRFPDEPKLQPLRCPEHDVDGLNEVLVSPELGGFTKTSLLKNVSSYKALIEIHQLLRQADKHDVVLIYYSGHGKLDPAGRLHLAMVDTTIDQLEATSIPVDRILHYIDVSPPNKVALMLDCCFSGAVGKFFRGGVDDELQRISREGRGTYLVTASTATQVAEERESDQYGLFTKGVIEGLQTGGADLDEDGYVTVDELYRYVDKRMRSEGFQRPMKWDLNVSGELVIARTGRSAREERRTEISELLVSLASQKLLPGRVLTKALTVLEQPYPGDSASLRRYHALLDQLLQKRLGIGEFVEKWYEIPQESHGISPLGASVNLDVLPVAPGLNAPAAPQREAHPENATISFIPLDIPGAHRSEAMGINDAGHITGYFVLDGRRHAFLRSDAGTYINLDVPLAHGNAWRFCGYGINDAGQIVGCADNVAGEEYGVLRFADGLFQPIGVPGARSSQAMGINAAGEIVGCFTDAAFKQHGYLRTATGTFITIDVPGATSTGAMGINAAGEIVGNFIDAGNKQHGFVRSALGAFTTIDVPGPTQTQAWGINDAKQIVGSFYVKARGRFYGFLRDATGTFTTIDVPDATNTQAHGINGAGQIVGSFEDAGKELHGFVTAS